MSRDQTDLQLQGRFTDRRHTQIFNDNLSLSPQKHKSAVQTWGKSKTLMNDFKHGDYVQNNTPGPIRVLRVKKESLPADAASIDSKLEDSMNSPGTVKVKPTMKGLKDMPMKPKINIKNKFLPFRPGAQTELA